MPSEAELASFDHLFQKFRAVSLGIERRPSGLVARRPVAPYRSGMCQLPTISTMSAATPFPCLTGPAE